MATSTSDGIMNNSFMIRCRAFSRHLDHLFDRYITTILNHPYITISIVLVLSTIISIYGILFNYRIVDFNPSKGFETRGTPLSEGKLLLEAFKDYRAGPVDILKSLRHRKTRSIAKNSTVPPTSTTLESISINYDDYGTETEPSEKDLSDICTQTEYFSDKLDYMDYFSKIILEIDDRHKLFKLDNFRLLCQVDDVIQRTIDETGYSSFSYTLNHSFNLPLLSNCLNLSTPNLCSALNQQDIDNLSNKITMCRSNSSSSDICKLNLFNIINNYLLPTDPEEPFIAIILKITASSSPQSFNFFMKLEKNLRKHFKNSIFTLRGAFFNMKNEKFVNSLRHDGILAFVSGVLVLACFLGYSRSLLFTMVIMMIVVLSMGIGFFVYAVILVIPFFPFLNLLVLVLMIAIAADDAFLLLSYYRLYYQKYSKPWTPGDPYLPSECRHNRSLREALNHGLLSMFITSATTAVAFLSNMISDVVVIRCFGIYACITVIINFFLVFLLLPSVLMVTIREKSNLQQEEYRKKSPDWYISEKVVEIVKNFRFVFVCFGVLMMFLSSFVVFYYPGMQMPKYNPAKVMTSSDVQEWFDDNSHLFNFEYGRKARLMEYYVITDSRVIKSNSLSPEAKGVYRPQTLMLSARDMENIDGAITNILYRRQPNYTSWASQFLSSASCVRSDTSTVISSPCFVKFSTKLLPSEFPENKALIVSDGPIFDKDLNIIGYFIAIPSNMTLTSNADKIEELFDEINKNCRKIETLIGDRNLLCLSSSEISQYYDIIQKLRPSTLQSVILSVVVSLIVIIFCTRRVVLSIVTILTISLVLLATVALLVLLGWQLSVVESTILVLTIGLSFDFSLHIAVAFRSTKRLIDDVITSSLASAGKACLLAAITSILCGLPLLFSQTAAFEQIGTMFVLLGFTSFIGACVLLPALWMIVHRLFHRNKVYTIHF